MSESLRNQRAVIIGASSGIGLATAHLLARAGAELVLANRNLERLDEVAKDLPGSHSTRRLDVTGEDGVRRFFDEVGRFDHLVVPAAGGALGTLSDAPTEDFRALPRASAYAAVGSAVEAAGRIWALEYAPIRINTVVPGVIDTPVWEGLIGEQGAASQFAQTAELLPVKRVGAPIDVARRSSFSSTTRSSPERLWSSTVAIASSSRVCRAETMMANVSDGLTLKGSGLAAHGYDVVAYFADGKPALGNTKFSAVYENATYRFPQCGAPRGL